MADWIKDLVQHAPFLVSSIGGTPKLNLPRVIEIVAVIAVVLYGMDKQQQALRQDIAELRLQVSNLSGQVQRLNTDVYVPKWETLPHAR